MSVNRKEGKEVTKRVSVWLFYSEPENSGIESQLLDLVLILKGVFAKNERGYRLNAIKKRF